MYQDNLKDTRWIGVVVDNNDPDRDGKIKVRVFGKFDELDDDDIPYARPLLSITSSSESGSGFLSLPKVGTLINVVFDNGDLYSPIYFSDFNISDELKERLSDNYANAQVLLYDTQLNVYIYHINGDGGIILRTMADNTDEGQTFNIAENGDIYMLNSTKQKIGITNSGANVFHKDDRQIDVNDNGISLGSQGKSAEPAVLGNKNQRALNDILNELQRLTNALDVFSKAQIAATANPVLAPLTPAFTALTGSLATILTNITQIIANLPQIKSNIVTLD